MWKTFLYSDRFSQGKRYWKRKPKLVDDGKSKQRGWQNYYKNTYTTTKLIYRFNAIPIKILILDFTGLEKKQTKNSLGPLEDHREPRWCWGADSAGICNTQQQSTHCYRMKNARGRCKDKTTATKQSAREDGNAMATEFLAMKAKSYNGEKKTIQEISLARLRFYLWMSEIRFTLYKNKIKMDRNPKS